MNVFKITGRVVNADTKEGIKGLRVEAWDKDLFVNDMVGSAITGEGGVFIIQFDESYFKELFIDRRPDLFFKVFKGTKLIKSTEDSVLWNVDREDIEQTIELEDHQDTATSEVTTNKNVSTRSMLQATYTPRKSRPGEDPSRAPRALEKAAFFARLTPTLKELDKIAEKYEKTTKRKSSKERTDVTKALKWVKTISNNISITGKLDVLHNGNIFADIETDALVFIAQDLIQGREGAISAIEIEHQYSLLKAFKENMSVECVGYLHLERLCYTPAGIEKGELVYSVPLSPGEEVNIRHREWSHITEEFERIVTDYLEEFSEEGVTEKTELAQTVDSEAQHSSAFSTGVTASGSYGSVSVTASVGYNASESSNKSTQLTRNHAADITDKASSRSKKEHKISFRVASATETEDESIQRIKNPFADRATRIDYYQLIRKWKIDLYRYGIRLTYDITIPEPGSGIISKIKEIRGIRMSLETGLERWIEAKLGQAFTMDDITPENFTTYAAVFGANVEGDPPIGLVGTRDITRFKEFRLSDEGGDLEEVDEEEIDFGLKTFEIELPEDIYILQTFYNIRVHCKSGLAGQAANMVVFSVGQSGYIYESSVVGSLAQGYFDGWRGRSGKVAVHFEAYGYTYLSFEFTFTVKSEERAYRGWQLRTWNVVREAAQANYYENRQKLKERLARLQEELGAQDALSLRKKEREEVMKGVLEAFGFSPADENYRDAKIIRFIHHALEWENMLYFLYPYFWADPDKQLGDDEEQEHPYWEFKKYLDHPDPMHRAFLKAGASRVVLPVRPGFEDSFLAFVNTGDMDTIPPAPYLEIGKEFEAYARTNYPGIQAANPIKNFRPLLTKKQQAAWKRMRLLIRLLEVFNQVNGKYPSSENGEDLTVLRDFFPFKDPWGRDYLYSFPGQHEPGKYDLYSFGADGQAGGNGVNADITNWDSTLPKDNPSQVKASRDIELIALLLEEYRKIHGAYPATEEGLFQIREIVPLLDPWGNDFDYRYPGQHLDYDLVSFGANGESGGEGKDADITNWAEASLIGQWFEYTPTSALDIAFDEEMPNA